MSRTVALLALAGCGTPDAVFGPIEAQPDAFARLFAPSLERTADLRRVSCDRVPDAGLLAQCDAGAAAIVDGVSYGLASQGIAAAPAGGVVWICPGTHRIGEMVSDLTLAAVDPAPGATVFDGQDVRRVLEVQGGDLVVDGIEITGGYDSGGAGALFAVDAVVGLVCTRFRNNETAGDGGAIYQKAGQMTILASTFEDNKAGYGGGAMAVSDWNPSHLTISDSVFSGNIASYAGGAITVGSWAHDTVVLNRVDFLDNSAGHAGGAVELGSWEQVTLSATGGLWEGNVSDYVGGALEVGGWQEFTEVTLTDVVIRGNAALSGAAINVGSRVDDGYIVLDGTTVWSNVSVNGPVVMPTSEVSVKCHGCNFGSGSNDNLDDDVLGLGPLGDGVSFLL